MIGNERWKATVYDVKWYVVMLKSECGQITDGSCTVRECEVVRPEAIQDQAFAY